MADGLKNRKSDHQRVENASSPEQNVKKSENNGLLTFHEIPDWQK